MMHALRKRGFTLIELLVVIGIIAVLSSVVLASLQGAKQTAQIAKTKNDIEQIKLALIQYAQDHGAYPACDPNSASGVKACCIGGITCSVGALTVSQALTELTAALKTHDHYALQPESLLASAYFKTQLVNPVIYSCSNVTSINSKYYCDYRTGDVILTYLLGQDATTTLIYSPSTTGTPNPVYGCKDMSANNYDTDPSHLSDPTKCTYDSSGNDSSGS